MDLRLSGNEDAALNPLAGRKYLRQNDETMMSFGGNYREN
jgi:hypothetical protein